MVEGHWRRRGINTMDPLSPSPSRFEWERHLHFLEMSMDVLPWEYESQEISRLTLAYFTISGLSVLNALDRVTLFSLIVESYTPLIFLMICYEVFGFRWIKSFFFCLKNLALDTLWSTTNFDSYFNINFMSLIVFNNIYLS